jgi:colanic acid biosynthesis glycosyl transferase WcaI
VAPKESPLKVLIIGEYFPPDIGGAATRASNIAKGLSMNGCSVTVVTAFPHYPTGKIPEQYKRKLLKVEYVEKSRILRTFVFPLESKGLLKRLLVFWSFIISSLFAFPFVGKVDVIWAANPDVFVLAPAIAYGILKKKPIVSNVDDLIIEDLYDLGLVRRGSLLSKIADSTARVLFSKVAAATPISPGYVPTIMGYGVDRDRVTVVRGGVDLDTFNLSPKCESKNFTVLYSGGLSIAYDFNQVLDAAKIVEKSVLDIEFIIQGKGELANSIHQRVKKLNLQNVKIIDILLSREDVGKFLATADVLILPLAAFKTPYRGMSSKLYEYQAVGKPIISCSNGLPSDYVRQTKSGITIDTGDSTGIAEAIIFLKENPLLASEMGQNGRRFVEKEASIKSIGFQLAEIFKMVEQRKSKTQ